MEKIKPSTDQFPRQATARRPLSGITILLVEDSRFCSEAVRLLCVRSGARLRRADSMAAARRHLKTYRPAVVIVDIGLPDGSGLQLVEELANLKPTAPAILVTSGEDENICKPAAMKIGADGFIAKPLKNFVSFQREILKLLPAGAGISLENVLNLRAEVVPDLLAMREDLQHLNDLLKRAREDNDLGVLTYCAQFLRSVADVTRDGELLETAHLLSEGMSSRNSGVKAADDTLKVIDHRLRTLEIV